MEKLSEEGKLYFNDYLILSEALNDTNRFLNVVVEKAHDIILKDENDLEPKDFTIGLWENKSNKGHLEV